MRKIYFAFLLLFIITNASYAATYYVSSSSGNDNNPGTSSSPWRNCPGMPGWSGSSTLSAGDTVFFNSSDTWTASNGNAILQVIGGVTYDGSTWGNGIRAAFRATDQLSRSVINIMNDDNSFDTVVKGFDVDANDQVLTGIGINWPQSSGRLTGSTKRIENCLVHNIWSSVSQGQYEYGIIMSDWAGANGTVENVEIIDCAVYNISRDAILAYPGNNDPNNSIGNIIIRGCEAYNTGQDPNYNSGHGLAIKNHVYNLTAEYNYFHDTGGPGIGFGAYSADFVNGNDNITIRHNILKNNGQDAIYVGTYGNKSIDIYGNLIIDGTYSGTKIDSKLEHDLSIRFYNNTYYNSYILVQSNSANIQDLEFRNNIIYAKSYQTPLQDTDGDITVHSNNIYYRSGGGTLASVNGTSYTVSNINTWESTAITSDPAFENASNPPTGFVGAYGIDLKPNTDGFNIEENSPAKDAGVSLSDNYKGSINSVTRPEGNAWDIGAYELDIETNPSPPPTPSNLRIVQ